MRPAEAIGRAIDRFYIGPVAAVVPRQTFRYAACGGLTYGLFDPACYFLVYNYIIAHRFVGLGFAVLSPHIAALALTFPLMNLAAAFGSLVGVGAATLISMRLGQRDYDTARRVLGNVVVLNAIIGVAFAAWHSSTRFSTSSAAAKRR